MRYTPACGRVCLYCARNSLRRSCSFIRQVVLFQLTWRQSAMRSLIVLLFRNKLGPAGGGSASTRLPVDVPDGLARREEGERGEDPEADDDLMENEPQGKQDEPLGPG